MATAGYRARLPASVVARVQRQAGPSMGETVARGVSALGEVALKVSYGQMEVREARTEAQHKIALLEQQRARASAVADGMGRLAQIQVDTEAELQGLRDRTAPGAPGYAGQAEEVMNRRWREFAETLPNDPEVVEHFAPMGARWLASGVSQERGWERERRVTHLGDQFEASLNTQSAALLGSPDPDAWASLVSDYDAAIALQDMDGTAKDALKLKVREELTGAMLDGLLQQDRHEAVAAALHSGQFDAWLGGADGKARWLDRVEAEGQRAERQAEIDASAARDEARTGLNLIKVRIDNNDFPTQAEITAAYRAAQAANVPGDELAEYAFLGERAVNRQQFTTMNDTVLQEAVATARAKQSAGRLGEAETRWLEQAEDALGERDGAKGDSLRTLWSSGPDGQQQAVRQLAAMAPERAWAAASRAGQPRAAIYARLGGSGQRLALQGAAVRAARPDDFLPGQGGAEGKTAAKRNFRAFIGEDLVRQLGGAFDDTFEAALDVMAGSGGEWNDANFRRAVRVVFGARERPGAGARVIEGGIGTVRGRMVELPDNMTATEFDAALSRADFSAARYRNGQAASKPDILANFLPVPTTPTGADGRTRYMFVDAAGHPLLRADGTPFDVYTHFGRTR